MHGEHALRVAEYGDRLGRGRIVAKRGGVDQRTQLSECDSRNAGRSLSRGAKTGRIRFETEQIDRTSGGGQHLIGNRIQQRLRRVGVGAQLVVERRIGALVGERHRPRRGLSGKGERVRLIVQSVEEEGVHGVPLFV